jgi:hypothetical protein
LGSETVEVGSETAGVGSETAGVGSDDGCVCFNGEPIKTSKTEFKEESKSFTTTQIFSYV